MAAIETASKVGDIGFPEFTSKLVKDTFDTLVASQIDQLEAYTELVRETAKTLSTYINDTTDSISGEEIFSFIRNVLPGLSEDAIESGNAADTPLSSDQATTLDNAVTVPEDDGSGSEIQASGTITSASSSNAILDAVATRIAANKYDLMVQIVQTGLIRLVIDNGVIESKLNFRTYEFDREITASTSYNRTSYGGGVRFGFFGRVFGLRGSAGYNRLRISTTSSNNTSGSGTNINIQGLVRINFSSDYRSLSEA